MIRFLIYEILLEHVNLIVSEHAALSYFAKDFHLSSKSLIFVNLLHETSVLLRLSRINSLRPATLSVVHTLIASAHTFGIDLMN